MTSPDDPCAGSEPNAWATGASSFVATDNDVFASGTRTNSFGQAGHGRVYEEATGEGWNLSWHLRLQINRATGEFRILTEVITLTKMGA